MKEFPVQAVVSVALKALQQKPLLHFHTVLGLRAFVI